MNITTCISRTMAVATVMLTVLQTAMLATAGDRTWGGGGINALASNPTNWVGGVAPVAGDAIVLSSAANKNMTWDLNVPLASWTQAGYVGTVAVATVYGTTGFTNLTILGDCVISNGVWTQSANPAVNYESNRLCVVIGGDLIVGSNAAIDVTARGYRSGWSGGPFAYGPGAPSIDSGAAYGGVGSGNGSINDRCYGSIIAPANLGSAGSSSSSYSGGGPSA